MNKQDKLKLLKLLKAKKIAKARKNHIDYMEYCWTEGRTTKFLKGFHTYKICEAIDEALNDYANGESSYLVVSLHPRGGKSQMTSKYLPPRFAAMFPGTEIMMSSYGTDLSTTFSEQGRFIVQSDKFKDLYPNTYLPFDSSAKSNWKLATENEPISSIRAMGILAGLNGKGYHLGLLDDFIKNDEQAGNKEYLEKLWRAFTSDFLTRRAPVSITIIIATQWDVSDIIGRIKNEMVTNEDFPKFKFLTFPARAKDYKGPGEYPNEFLFEERFSKKYYYEQYATLGKRKASALYDCNPLVKGGEIFNTNNIEWVDTDDPRIVRLKSQKYRVWDLAHTAQSRSSSDPDWTAGSLICYEKVSGDPIIHLWVLDVVRCREGAVKRDSIIRKTADRDGRFVKQAIETSLDSKDAYIYLRQSMPDIKWIKINIQGKGDKLVRATPLEPIFEAPKHVHVVRGSWNNDWIEEVEQFNGLGKQHDDMVDNLSSSYIIAVDSNHEMTAEQRALMRGRNT